MKETRKPEKHVSRKKAPVFTITGWFLCLLIPLLLYALFTAYVLTKSVKINETLGCIGYNEIGSSDYSVTYNNNEQYKNATYTSGMKYVSSLIDKINSKFKYEIHATQEMNYVYNYTITGDIVYYDYVDENAELKRVSETLVNSTEKTSKGSYLTINEDYDVDFGEYYQKAKSYRQDTGISASADLILTFKLNLAMSALDYDKSDKVTREFTITVPLTESTIKIDKSDSLNENGSMCQTKAFRISNIGLFITGIISVIIIFVCVILIVIELYKIITKDPYKNEVNKILKEYDRLIVSGKYDVDDANYSNVIYPTKFEEMVDASINLSEPILFYDVHPGNECHFIIIDDETMYKYRISRREIELNKMGDK